MTMRRRDFLRSVSMASVGGLTLRGFSSPRLLPLLTGPADDRVLVIVQLYGGNDGLNTVIPLDQYSALSGLRSNVLIPQNQVLPLSGTGGATGLHPKLGGLQHLWNEGKLSIVQGVGYPNPNLSHFRSTEIWETAANSNQTLGSGWLGRYLNLEYPNYPVDYPNATMPDPLAIRVGGPISSGLVMNGVSMGASIYNTLNPFNLANNAYVDPATADCKGSKLELVRTIQRQTDLFGNAISAASTPSCNMSPLYPTGSHPGAGLAYSLQIVARLICGGLKTRVYWVSTSGFDTHSDQVVSGNTTEGRHANLLHGLGDAIRAFQHDLELLGVADRVVGMTFSEFGRRIRSNNSRGTDHGAAAPMFLFGTNVIPGMLGHNPIISPNSSQAANLPMQYDFRSVYASVMKDWFCLNPSQVQMVVNGPHQPLNLISAAGCISTSVHEANQLAGRSILEVYPNPFVERTTVKYTSTGGRILLEVHDEQGRLVRTLLNDVVPEGDHTIDCDLGPHAPGTYYCRLQNGSHQQLRTMFKVR
jgi:uncharacterized protein (DUF1501 family)